MGVASDGEPDLAMAAARPAQEAGAALFGGLYLVLKLMEWWSNPRDEE